MFKSASDSVRQAYGVAQSVDALSAPDARKTLRANIAAGVRWGMLISVVTQVTRIAVGVVLAHLLTPGDYGLAAMAFVCGSFVLTLSDASLGKALVQRPSIDELDRSTVFWATVAIGLVLTTVGVAASGTLAHLFHQPRLQPLVAVLSISFFLVSLQMTQVSLFQREMMFKATTLRLITSALVSAAVGVAIAAMGGGAWALIVQQVTLVAVSTLLLWVLSPWRPRLIFSWSRLKTLSHFGLGLMGSRLLDDVNTNADNMLIGRFLGSAALGAYSIAYNLMTLPLMRVIIPIQDTLFPAYARMQDDLSRVRSLWLRTTVIVVSVVAPVMVGVAVVAPEFVRLALGTRWTAAVPVLRILAPLAVAQTLSALAATTLTARGRTTTLFRFSVANTALVIPAFIIGLQWGIVGVAAAYACVVLPMAALLVGVAARELGSSSREVIRSLKGPCEAVASLAVATLLAEWLLSRSGLPAYVELLLVVVVGASVYVPICVARIAAVRSELKRLRMRRDVLTLPEPSVAGAD